MAPVIEQRISNELGACPASSAQVYPNPATSASSSTSGDVVSADVRRCPSESRYNCPHFCPRSAAATNPAGDAGAVLLRDAPPRPGTWDQREHQTAGCGSSSPKGRT